MSKFDGINSKDVTLKVNGTELQLKRKTKIDELQSKEQQVLASIFDENRDGILQKDEIEAAKDFTEGIYNVHLNKDNTSTVEYIEDVDNDGKLEYSSTWKLDNENRIIDRVKDENGDGKIDSHVTCNYNSNGEISGREYSIDEFDDGYYLETVTYFDEQNEITYERLVKNENGNVIFRIKEISKDGDIEQESIDYPDDREKDTYDSYNIPSGMSEKEWEEDFDKNFDENM